MVMLALVMLGLGLLIGLVLGRRSTAGTLGALRAELDRHRALAALEGREQLAKECTSTSGLCPACGADSFKPGEHGHDGRNFYQRRTCSACGFPFRKIIR